MICFHLDGSIQAKENICSCEKCIEGDFIGCVSEKGRVVYQSSEIKGDSNDEEDESDDENEVEESDNVQEEEDYEIRGSNIMACITKNSVIALFSDSSALELFYLCRG